MQLGLSLLMAAVALLTQVSHTPNISPVLRDQAQIVANQAIALAQVAIQSDSSVVVQSTPSTPGVTPNNPTPTFGNVTSIPVLSQIKLIRQAPTLVYGGNCNNVSIQVEPQDQFGNRFDTPLFVYNVQNNSTSTIFLDTEITPNRYIFYYRPLSTNAIDKFIFSSEGVSLEHNVTVGNLSRYQMEAGGYTLNDNGMCN